MVDTHLRTEGDYEYWESDGVPYRKYAKDNSQGKRRGAFKDRHPKATQALRDKVKRENGNDTADLALSTGSILNRYKVAKVEERREMSLQAMREALLLHPDAAKEQDGLRMLWEARIEQANDSEGGASAVNAHKLIEEHWSGGREEERVIDARQIHITVSPGAGTDLSRFAQLIDITPDEDEEDSASQSPD